MVTYGCPKCRTRQGRWKSCLNHLKYCCPKVLLGDRKSLRKRCAATGKRCKAIAVSTDGGAARPNRPRPAPESKKAPSPNSKDECKRNLPRSSSQGLSKRQRRGMEVLGSVWSRSKVLVCGDEAVVKKVPGRFKCPDLCDDGQRRMRKTCLFAVDPARLFQLRCTRCACDQTMDMSREKSEYLWCRRRTRKTLGLLSVAAPLKGLSVRLMSDTARSCGIFSNTAVAHITVVEGYQVPSSGKHDKEYPAWFESFLRMLEAIRLALRVDPTATITSLNCVPRISDRDSMLVVADVTLSSSADKAAEKLRTDRHCILPQFSLHVAVGACSANKIDSLMELARQRLVGLTLFVDGSMLSVLAPSLYEKVAPGSSLGRIGDVEERAKRLETNTKKFGDVIATAQNAADHLNMVLSSTSDSVFSSAVDRSRLGARSTKVHDEITHLSGASAHVGLVVQGELSAEKMTVADRTKSAKCPSKGSAVAASCTAIRESTSTCSAPDDVMLETATESTLTDTEQKDGESLLPRYHMDAVNGRVCYICRTTCWATPYCCWKL
mmetsp:Transcript_29168/g.63297  ORF Transcript_29168/g.63297 Transcript_29168/m.63297 type:complete len:550 (+) Transcript_29168:131-1780(+)